MATRSSAFFQVGDRAYSYQTAIKDRLPDGRTIGNVTEYSPTTSRHQGSACVRACDVLVTGVPQGTADLAKYFAEGDFEVARTERGVNILRKVSV